MARIALQASLDAVDTAARCISTVVVMHRVPWLQLSRFLREVQNAVEDLPFDGHKYFLETMKDSRATLHSSVIYTPISKNSFNRSQTAQRSCPAQFSGSQRPAELPERETGFRGRGLSKCTPRPPRHLLNSSFDGLIGGFESSLL